MRTLWQDGEVLHLGSRAFEILAVIASAGGRLVTKDELMNAVWPETIVEENNIQVHLSALRKILGPDRDLILTVPGRGYQLTQRQKQSLPGQSGSHAPTGRPLPLPKTRLVGRDAAVKQIRAMLEQTHVLTLVGAGGIGKTSLAIETARRAVADFPDSVCLVELTALNSHEAVLAAIVKGCGLPVEGAPLSIARIASALAGKRLLLLDNAEHVVGHVAQIVESLIAANALLRVLVTSREPLRIMPEAVFRVDPLDVPPPHATDAEILQRSAVKLFLMRANSLQGQVGADSLAIQLVGEICRRLDGIPLALELAAARAVALGVEGVYRRLDDPMALLGGGYRTALPRHQTLRATFDWSFSFLKANTQLLFRRLAVFSGDFTFEAMCAVVCDAQLTVGSAISGISELVAKSLINIEFDGAVARYRLYESTRAYALEKLQAEGETHEITSRRALYLSCGSETRPSETLCRGADQLPDLRQTLDDARSAFDWVFSRDGDPRLGVELASNPVGAMLDCGMIAECCTRATQAVKALENLPAGSVDAASEMRVRAALASALPYVRGPVSKSAETSRGVFTLAIECGEPEFHARAAGPVPTRFRHRTDSSTQV
jgi:predicted ATPase/DNA-binding winged helix-turn-helix (wHTH) protein